MGETGTVRSLLMVFNVLFWVSGLGIFGSGCYFFFPHEERDKSLTLIHFYSEPMIQYCSYILIAMGAVAIIGGFFGCCGAVRKNRNFLIFYLICLVIPLIGEITSGVLISLFKNHIETRVKDGLIKSVKEGYNTTSEYDEFTLALFKMQAEWTCCGIRNAVDYEDSMWRNNTGERENVRVPVSCCILMYKGFTNIVPYRYETCQLKAYEADMRSSKSWMNYREWIFPFLSMTFPFLAKLHPHLARVVSNRSLNSLTINFQKTIQGCYDMFILRFLREEITLFVGISFGLSGVGIFGFILTVWMIYRLGQDKLFY